MKSRRLTLCAMLTAIAIICSIVEKWIPLTAVIPVPGIKLGLANIITLFALKTMRMKETMAILVCRIALVSLFMGSVTGFVFSLCGGVLAMMVMAAALRQEGRFFSLYGISIAGAASHNIGQILAAMLWLGSANVIGYLPLLLVSSIVMGFLTGAVCTTVLTHLKKIQIL